VVLGAKIYYGIKNLKREERILRACMREQPIGLVWGTALPVEADELSANWDTLWDYPA
jgi:hypothetical protein